MAASIWKGKDPVDAGQEIFVCVLVEKEAQTSWRRTKPAHFGFLELTAQRRKFTNDRRNKSKKQASNFFRIELGKRYELARS